MTSKVRDSSFRLRACDTGCHTEFCGCRELAWFGARSTLNISSVTIVERGEAFNSSTQECIEEGDDDAVYT